MIDGIVLLSDVRSIEGGWVIEHADSPVSQPSYFTFARNEDGQGFETWTPSEASNTAHARAARFARKEDAEAFLPFVARLDGLVALLVPMPEHRIAYHEWG